MSQKQEKKIRKLFNKEYRRRADELASNQINMLKPKPKWFPMWLWVKLLSIFIRVKVEK